MRRKASRPSRWPVRAVPVQEREAEKRRDQELRDEERPAQKRGNHERGPEWPPRAGQPPAGTSAAATVASGTPGTAPPPGTSAAGTRRPGREPATASTCPSDLPPLPANRYLDQEESWLRFNQRVLELAEDESVPLLERVRFLAIFASNLDEFFMVKLASLMRRMAAGLPVEGVSVKLPGQVLNRTLDLAGRLTARPAACFTNQILPSLAGRESRSSAGRNCPRPSAAPCGSCSGTGSTRC